MTIEDGSLTGFCGRYGLSRARVARWAKQLPAPEAPVRFHPVEVVSVAKSAAALLEIELPGGVTVRLPRGFAADDLRQALSVLAEHEPC